MKSIQATYEDTPESIAVKEGAEPENWVEVCRKFNDDVERICDVTGLEDYTGLYVCFDDANTPSHYLVQEDKKLFRLKRKHFLDNIGLK